MDATEASVILRCSMPADLSNSLQCKFLTASKDVKRNQLVIVMIDWYSKLRRAVPPSKTTASHATLTFIDNWTITHGVPNFLLTDSGLQFLSKFFNALCGFLGVRQLTITAYRPQRNDQTERYNKTIVAKLHQHVNERKFNWELFVQSLT